jgi:hypothetical protein
MVFIISASPEKWTKSSTDHIGAENWFRCAKAVIGEEHWQVPKKLRMFVPEI